MKDLFYSKQENILFWVAGYTRDGNTDNVLEIIQDLIKNAETFSKIADCQLSEVKTFYNNQPPRYQYMRIFYAKTEHVPEEAFVIGTTTDWTMRKWITS